MSGRSRGTTTLIGSLRREIGDRKQAERELEAVLRLHETTLETIPSSLLVLDKDLNILMVNRRFLETHDVEASEVLARDIRDVFPLALMREQSLLERMRAVAEDGGQDELMDVLNRSGDHPDRHLNIRICGIHSPRGVVREPRVLLVIEDVTQQKSLEEQLRHVVKMESIGRLAGGVAHDFNNLLTGIKGYVQLLLRDASTDARARRDLAEVDELASRAADLTRQLLTFSRRQRLEPVALNINDLVANITKMLRRLIGEDIDLKFIPAPDLGTVQADLSQMEQVVMNLTVNARDAMPEGGKLTVETANIMLDDEYARDHVSATPGPHVMLAVTDTGSGMDQATLEHVFEPFFTTKSVGNGTGLGLATVYGIVKRHGGNIWVYSEPGMGTTFKIYLPRVDAAAQKLPARREDRTVPCGSETILIAEDERAVLDVARRTLEAQGYAVLAAARPDEAEVLFARHLDEVALLLADVVMPVCSGRALYERLTAERPLLKVLYMSGYTGNAVVRHGVLNRSTPFIQKPFSPDTLARKVREVLDG